MSVPSRFWNSPNNQALKRDFVHNEVYTCISDMAQYLFDYDGEKYASYDDFSNTYEIKCPHCLERLGDWDELLDFDEDTMQETHLCPYCYKDIPDEPDSEPVEILEYYLVSPWLGVRLRQNGECVLPRYGAWIWGRQCSGQAILLDRVISVICNDLDLLVEEEP